MKYKIVTDSSCNLFEMHGIDYTVLPLVLSTGNKEYIDNKALNVVNMMEDISQYSGDLQTISPSKEQWLEAFGDADIIFGVTITNALSDSFKSAREAKKIYESKYPGRKVFIFDSLSTGPEVTLIVRKLAQLIQLKKSYTEIRNTVMDYMQHTQLMFALPKVKNFVDNDLMTPKMAKKSTKEHINIIGRASFEGKFEPVDYCRSQKRALKKLVEQIKETGYHGGTIIISHTQNEDSAISLANLLKEAFGNIHIDITANAGLCSFYSAMGGLLVGFEI